MRSIFGIQVPHDMEKQNDIQGQVCQTLRSQGRELM
jgi:hypothetical protein